MVTDQSGFIQTVKEMAEYLAKYSPRYKNEEYLGDWRAVKNHLNNGDLQALIYRKVSEINLVYGAAGDEKIEMQLKVSPIFDQLFEAALRNYIKSKDCARYVMDGEEIKSILFEDVGGLYVFVNYYLWEFTKKEGYNYE